MAFGGSIKLTGESEYRKALKDITSDMRLMASEMKVMATSTDASGKATDADKARKQQLTKAIAEQRDRLVALNAALQESNAKNGTTSASSKQLQTQINNSTAQLNRMESQLNTTGTETGKLGTEMDGTGKKASIFGDVLKANLVSEAIVGGIKAIGSAIKTLGTGFVSLVKDSISAYADYEQLVGGVETLFKQSSGTVTKYADMAYKTAGLSANAYMETVTSFSASLLQGLGGDTKKAADIGNLAVTDMADNANKMGTDIGMIQNAYQGFAKDNYTMLDNLKLGYGGTAGEMARLVNDSGVMGKSFKATAENVKDIPFDKLIESIHKTQNEMGITGTTAKEASSTISGSMNSVKASWENVLTSFASGNNEQIKESIDGLIEGVTNLVTNLGTILPNVVNGIAQMATQLITQLPALITLLLPPLMSAIDGIINAIVTVLPKMVPVAISLIMKLVDTIITNLPKLIEAGITVLVALITGIANALPKLVPKIVDAVILIVETLIDNLDLLIEAGIKIIIALIQGIANSLPRLIAKMPELVEKIVTALIKNAPLLVGAALQIIVALAGGLIGAVPKLIATAPKLIAAIVNGVKKGVSGMASAGADMVKGLWNGISNMVGWIGEKIKGFGSSVMNGIKSFFGIKSPSRKMRDEVGKFLAEGVGVGFEDKMGEVTKNMQDALPQDFDTSVNLNGVASATSGLSGASAGAAASPFGFSMADLTSAIVEGLQGMNVVLDDEKVGTFVTDTIEAKVLGR